MTRRTPLLPPWVILAPALLALGGCGTDAGPGDDAIVDDAAEWTLRESLRIGSLDGPDALGVVSGLVATDGGTILVLQPRERVVHLFREHVLQGTLGREGDAPGEFRALSAMGLTGDTVWAADDRLRRVTFFHPVPHLLDTHPYPDVSGLQEGESASFGAVLADGRVVYVTQPGWQSPLEGQSHRFPVLSVPLRGGPADTLTHLYRDRLRAAFVQTDGGGDVVRVAIVNQPFTDAGLWDVSANGRHLAVVDRRIDPAGAERASPTFTVTRLNPAGDTLAHVEVPYEKVPVDPAHRDSLVASIVDGAPMGGDAATDSLFLPSAYAPVSAVVAGEDGTIWVAREDRPREPREWEIYDPEGERIGEVFTPPNVRVHQASRREIWTVETDQLDVPSIVRFTVVPLEDGNTG